MKTVIYPGTFDPLTLGHYDIIQRATHLFDQVIIAVAEGHHKQIFLAHSVRIQLIQEAVAANHNVRVEGFGGLLIDFVKHHQADVILRGIRNPTDFDQELQFAMMNKELGAVDTIFLTPAIESQFISSSLIREIFKLKGNIRPFVPENVAQYLYQALTQ